MTTLRSLLWGWLSLINLFARHTFQQPASPPTVKAGEEIFLPWNPPTDDLSRVDAATLDSLGVVPVRPEEGGVRLTIPAQLPEGPVQVTTRASSRTERGAPRFTDRCHSRRHSAGACSRRHSAR